MDAMRRCSAGRSEPLPGTAKRVRTLVTVVKSGGWGSDVLDGHAFGEELSHKLADKLAAEGASLQLIRRPGKAVKEAFDCATHVEVFLTFAGEEEPVTEALTVDSFEALLNLDLIGPGRNGGIPLPLTHPMVLICTHGKRDQCCAVKGRPLALALDERYPDRDIIWESSHVAGHRFAPAVMVAPWLYSFGHLSAKDGAQVVADLCDGVLPIVGNRGRGTFDPQSQVAEIAVAQALLPERVAPGQLVVAGVVDGIRQVTDSVTSRSWRVKLVEKTHDDVVVSCGKPPVTKESWQVVSVVAQVLASHDFAGEPVAE